MDENNMNQGYPDNQTGGYADPSMNGYVDPNANGYADPNTNGYVDPNAGGYAAPNTNGYMDPNAGGYYADPNMNGYADPNMNGYADPNMGYYNDPNMNGYANPNMGGYYANPDMNGYGDPTPYQAQPPKKKKGGKIALICVICVLVVAAAGILTYCIFRKTPEEAVKSAMKKTFTDSAQNTPLEDAVGLSDFSEDKMDFTANLTVETIYEMSGLSGSTLELSGAFEKQDDGSYNMSLTDAATIGGETLTVSLTSLDKVIYYELPEWCDCVFQMDLASMMSTLDSSELDAETQNEVKELYNQYMVPATKELKESVTYEKAGSTKIENQSGDTVRCKQYTVTLPQSACRDYVEALANYLDAYASDYITDEQLDEAGITRAELLQVLQYLPTYFGMIFSKDFVLDVYVKHGDAIRIDMDYKFTALGATASMTLDMMGEDSPMDDVFFEAEFQSESDNTTPGKVTYSSKTKTKSGKTTNEASGSIEANGETAASLSKSSTYDEESKKFTSDMTVSAGGSPVFGYELSAELTDIKKGTSFGMTLDRLAITNGDSTVYAEFSGQMQYGDLGFSITAPDSSENILDYSVLSTDDMSEYLDMDAIERTMSAWGNAVGTDDTSAFDMFNDIVTGDDTSQADSDTQ